MTAPRLTRTYLAVPAHRERFVQNAAASAADAVFMDLEDAVPPAEKAGALEAAAAALASHDWGRKTVSVRLNAIDSPTIEVEIARLAAMPRLDAFIIPKAEQPCDIASISRRIAAASGSRSRPVEMELLIETARGLVNVEALAGADPLVSALHLGVGDFAASIGARSAEIGAVFIAQDTGTASARIAEVLGPAHALQDRRAHRPWRRGSLAHRQGGAGRPSGGQGRLSLASGRSLNHVPRGQGACRAPFLHLQHRMVGAGARRAGVVV